MIMMMRIVMEMIVVFQTNKQVLMFILACLMFTESTLGFMADGQQVQCSHTDAKLSCDLLQRQLYQLLDIVNDLRHQNKLLSHRVALLETCDCKRTGCLYDNRVYKEGETWSGGEHQVCTCIHGETHCEPCSCQNGGVCVPSNSIITCECPVGFNGVKCEERSSNPAVYPPDPGSCTEKHERFYFDIEEANCKTFTYSGCGGNSNNFVSKRECTEHCVQGACCLRKLTRQGIQVTCKDLTWSQCWRQNGIKTEDKTVHVMGFKAGQTCNRSPCVKLEGQENQDCVMPNSTYNTGDTFRLGCEQCQCRPYGSIKCSCSKLYERKELHDMSLEEIVRFQRAVTKLRQTGQWELLRDTYMDHVISANSKDLFLHWNRAFLYHVEKKLQEIDCVVTIPYFQFVQDVRNFGKSLLWQANMFGGNGEGNNSCVSYLPFGPMNLWKPCVRRQFNENVTLPTMLEVSSCLMKHDGDVMSQCLQAVLGYVHAFVGGDMVTPAAAYDPAFLPIHAYIDMLFNTWQTEMVKRFDRLQSRIMLPLSLSAIHIQDSETDLCIVYVLPGLAHPCNVSVGPDSDGLLGYVIGNVSPLSVIEQFYPGGYDADGFDSIGFNVYGFDREGFTRDDLNITGHRRNGMDRYSATPMYCTPDSYHYNIDMDEFGYRHDGYDHFNCNYGYYGPHIHRQTWAVMELLLKYQTPEFLHSLSRQCGTPRFHPDTFLMKLMFANENTLTDLFPVMENIPSMSYLDSRVCFNAWSFLRLLICNCKQSLTGPRSCKQNPCAGATCSTHPNATCVPDMCGGCQAMWILNNQKVQCQPKKEKGPCEPNPCENGGTCMPSLWPKEPNMIQCLCPPEYQGVRCETPAQQICVQPLQPGTCSKEQKAWFYNLKTCQCERFTYTGCGGSGNNFPWRRHCHNLCELGACCYRRQLLKHPYGYDMDGYDRYGFTVEGQGHDGRWRTGDTGFRTGRHVYNKEGFDWKGFDPYGRDSDGFDHHGFDISGYHRFGFNITGFSKHGEYDGRIEFDSDGYNNESFDRAGFNCYGYNNEGLDYYGRAAGFSYTCMRMSAMECRELERESRGIVQVVSFSQGKSCEDVGCQEKCGCVSAGNTYRFGETFRVGCNQCRCQPTGQVECRCTHISRRKEIRDLSSVEWEEIHTAIRELTSGPRWVELSRLYADHVISAWGHSSFLSWHRFFIRSLEQELQANNCNLAIPYFDWTLDVGDLNSSMAWQANAFGGNGKAGTSCVQYHPFKSKYPYYWDPCLRRDFNTSIYLPDTVDLEILLREPDFLTFQSRLEQISAMFHLWVGGHMEGDYAAYDPIFYAHHAFVDKLWDDWQKRHPEGLLTFPQDKRYIPMRPFKTTPDDVFDSKNQMCVQYVPISRGVTCTKRSYTYYGFDQNGFDRHGFDRMGYDKDAYNEMGISKSGSEDMRGIYNVEGVDMDGYNRRGYDSQGYDRFGFHVDSFNRDGFNGFGFDRYGFDRYGFNIQGMTPFGYYRNGSFGHGIYESDLDIFDNAGYNKYGMNKKGLDRKGYDIFGFDINGFDHIGCKNYRLGPFYVLHKIWLDEKLKDLTLHELRQIKRLCPTPLVPWDVINKRFGLEGSNQTQNQTPAWEERQINPKTVTGGITENNVWLPHTPDNRFCIEMNRYSGCPIGHEPSSCPESLCVMESCPGRPTASCRVVGCDGECKTDWYDASTGQSINCSGCVDQDGNSHPEGASWTRDHCYTCTCKNAEVSCSRILCDVPRCKNPEPPRDRCCPRCEGCHFKRRTFWNGQNFLHPDNPCKHCICMNGNVSCQTKQCPALSCDSPELRPGRCCPTCPLKPQAQTRACFHNNRDYQEGEEVPMPHQHCKSCICHQGEIQCASKKCQAVKCDHPAVENCCPVCSGCDYRGETYDNLHVFPDPDNACNECTCVMGSVTCAEKPCPVKLNCLHPATPQGRCCPKCKDCKYLGKIYDDKQQFESPDDTCTMCQCESGTVVCNRRHCPPARCSHPTNDGCCPSCNGCTVHGMRYIHGQTFVNALNVCEDCECSHGNVTCRVVACEEVRCTHPVQGHCCPECGDCLYDGNKVHNGAMVQHIMDSCMMCHCQDGSVLCERKPCPAVQCMHPVQGECCLECPPGCELNGQTLEEGQTIPHPADQCGECTCMGGEVSCQHRMCKPVSCSHPAFDECRCPTCNKCLDGQRLLVEGAMFTKANDPCQMCHCQAGNVTCKKVECPDMHNCPHPSYTPGQCCPMCKDCEFEGRMVKERDSVHIPSKPCHTCLCKAGGIECEKKPCARVACRHPYQGPCCPECGRCTYKGNMYQHGEHFHPSACLDCQCQRGTVECKQMKCPALTCPHKTTPPGECCPVCAGCVHGAVTHPEGSTWTSPEEVCVTCSCQQGVSVCTPTHCLSPCDKPITPPAGKCCPVCPGCDLNNETHGVGEPFSPTGNPQDICICRGGFIECFKKYCPTPLLCPNEVSQATREDPCGTNCQQVTNLCSSDQQGMVVRPTQDPCFQCQCKGLYQLQCNKKTCPDLHCPEHEHRYSPGICCPRCDKCHVDEIQEVFNNGDTWIDPRDPCRMCQCQGGIWRCHQVECRPLVCKKGTEAHKKSDQCCPLCVPLPQLSCLYNGKKYPTHEVWSVDECTTCQCEAGKVQCETDRCPVTVCPTGQSPTLIPGVCCPVCMPAPGKCVAFGDPHYKTYDGRMIHFQGACSYVMSADCRTGDFRVEAEHDDRGTAGRVSWVKSLKVVISDITISLLPKGRVKINDAEKVLPYQQGPLLSVERTGDSVLLNTKLGLKVLWDGSGYVEISIPGSYQEKVCGLCGNFNQFPQDDLTTNKGQIVTSTATFGNSWKVEDNSTCGAASDYDPCKKAGYHRKRIANSKCSAIRGPEFQKCYGAVRPDAYFASCVYDLCVCGDKDTCLCDVLASYALACARAGITLKWRSNGLCAMSCDESRGFMFDECGPRCPRTCENRDVPLGEVGARCLKPCVPSCQCPAHLVLHNDRCIPENDCPV